MTAHEFRVTVEDISLGERQVMEFSAGDYVLIPFSPCVRSSITMDLLARTHVITVSGFGPGTPARIVAAAAGGAEPPKSGCLACDPKVTADGDAVFVSCDVCGELVFRGRGPLSRIVAAVVRHQELGPAGSGAG